MANDSIRTRRVRAKRKRIKSCVCALSANPPDLHSPMKTLVWLGGTYTPVCALLELRLIVGTPLGDARRTGPINIVIGVPVALELSAPAFLGGVVGIVQPAVCTHQPQERRRIPFTHPGAAHPFVWIHIAERSVVIANVLVDPGEV